MPTERLIKGVKLAVGSIKVRLKLLVLSEERHLDDPSCGALQ